MSLLAVDRFQDLVERDGELVALGDLVGRAARGESGVLLVEGSAGVGKTRLLGATLELARAARVGVLQARGGELESSFPFGVARQLFTPVVSELGREQRESVLSGAAELALEIVDPRAAAATFAASPEDALYGRLHGLYWLCAGLAGHRPVVVVVDDAHWGDQPSLRWLLFMARRIREMPITLVLSARPAAAGDWPQPLALLRNEPDVAVLRPQPLTVQGSRIVIERMLAEVPEDGFSAACHRATGGNPFLLVELMASVREDRLPATAASAERIRALAPKSVARSVVVRLGRLPREAAALAGGLAVLGGEGELRHAAALANLELDDAAVAADALAAAGLVAAGRPLRLIHPVVRTVLYGEMPAGERARLHRRAAAVLADEEAEPSAICAHLLASEPAGDAWTTGVLVSAAERALARGAPGTAVGYLRRALAEPPPAAERPLVLGRLALAESGVGDPAAADHARQAIGLAADRRQRAELAHDQSVAYLAAGRFGDAVRALEQAVEDCQGVDEELGWRLEAQLISYAGIDPAHADVAARHRRRIPRDLPADSPGARAVLATLAVAGARAAEPVEESLRLLRRADVDGRLLAEQPPGSLLLQNAIRTLVLGDQHEAAERAYGQLLEQARRAGSPIVFAIWSAWRSQLRRLGGSLPAAIDDAQAAVDAGMGFEASLVAPMVYGVLAGALIDAGDVAGAQRALSASGVGEQIPPVLPFLTVLDSRGRVRLAQGDAQAGIEDLLAAHELLARFWVANPAGTHCRSTAAIALARLGRDDQARALAADELAAARSFGAPATVGTALRAVGAVERSRSGIEALRDAVALLEGSPARLQHARALVDLGAALRRDGKRREAQSLLRQALDLADRCGAKPVAEQARDELVITGARPRRARLSGVEALTASERRVAALAADGLSNREIAQTLWVSQPTVTTHLTHCYQKLAISSRGQLAHALGSHPPQP